MLAGCGQFYPGCPGRRERGNPAPAAPRPGWSKLLVRVAIGGQFRASGDHHVRADSPPGTSPAHRNTAGCPRPRRLAAALAALTCALLASAAIVPAAWAVNVIPPGGGDPAATVPVISGAMAGWQITLIALGAALVAATAAVVLDRARSARRSAPAT